jgi:hypothetical protein
VLESHLGMVVLDGRKGQDNEPIGTELELKRVGREFTFSDTAFFSRLLVTLLSPGPLPLWDRGDGAKLRPSEKDGKEGEPQWVYCTGVERPEPREGR